MKKSVWLIIAGCVYVTSNCIGANEAAETEGSIFLHELYALFGSPTNNRMRPFFGRTEHEDDWIDFDRIQEEIAAAVEKREPLEEKHRYLQSIASLTERYPQWLDLVPWNIKNTMPKPSKIDNSPEPRETTLKEMGSKE